MTIEELLEVLTEKGAGILQTPSVEELPGERELWAIMPDGRQYYLGVRHLLLQMPVNEFRKSQILVTLSSSEDELVARKAHTVTEFILNQVGLDLSAQTPYMQEILPRMLHALLDEVYGDRRKVPHS